MQFTTILFVLSIIHASVAVSVINKTIPTFQLKRRGCTPSKSSTPGAVDAPTFEPFDPQTAQVYRYQKQVGANLGSMFAHEEWMDDSPFSCATGPKEAEIDIAGGWNGVAGAQQELEWHWDNWITEDHISQLAGMGINTLRLPMGYWSAGPTWCENSPFSDFASVYTNSWNRVLRTVSWAEKNKMGVLIDLHGAYGSQNGQAHSGISDGQTGLFDSPDYIKQTQNLLVWLVKQFDQVNNIVGIELLNEPQYGQQLLDFYTSTIPLMRAASASMPLYLHDGFQLSKMVNYVTSNLDQYQPIIVDNHSYFVFGSSQQNTPITDITDQINSNVKSSLTSANGKLNGNLIVGEMGCANADGQSVSNMDSALKSYCEAQVTVYSDVTAGWIFWAAMMSGCSEASGDGWCLLGSAGKYLPTKFVAPSGQISSGGVTITGGDGSSNSTTSGSGSNSTSTDTGSDDGDGSDGGDGSDSGTSTSTSGSGSNSTSTDTGSDDGDGSDGGDGSDSGTSTSTADDSGSTSTSDDSGDSTSTTDDSGPTTTSTSSHAGHTGKGNHSSTMDSGATNTAAVAQATSTGGSCKANQSSFSSNQSKKKRHNKASKAAAASRRRHHIRALQERASDQGYTEGHIAAGHFARAGKTLGFPHAYVKARMVSLGVDEEQLDYFKRGFEVGHQEGHESWSEAALRK